MFRALVLDRTDDGVGAEVLLLTEDRLPEGDVLLDVAYSSLNYKDALAVTGRGKIVRGAYPFVPGIDLVGTVVEAETDAFRPGDRVIGTGWGLGENRWGGYAGRQRVPASSLVALPERLSPLHAMALGTAGLTAMLSVMALEAHGVRPDDGDLVVTGATGGVGSLAVALLARRGFRVIASTGKTDDTALLERIGAAGAIDRSELGQGPARPLDSARWAGAVDTVGGPTLAAILSTTGRHGSVAACGLAGGSDLATTVFPFILRGVNLLGIDSNTCPNDRREMAWRRLADELPGSLLDDLLRVISLDEVPVMAGALLAGRHRGRIVIDVQV